MIREIRTATITEKGQITIPKEMRKLSGFSTGDKISIIVRERGIELLPMEYIEKMESALLSEKSLAKDWLSDKDEKAFTHLQKHSKKRRHSPN